MFGFRKRHWADSPGVCRAVCSARGCCSTTGRGAGCVLQPHGHCCTPGAGHPKSSQISLVSVSCLPLYSAFLPRHTFLIRRTPVLSLLAHTLIWEAQFSLALQISTVLCKVKSITCKITLLSPGYQLYQ